MSSCKVQQYIQTMVPRIAMPTCAFNNGMGQAVIVYAHNDKRQISEITRCDYDLPHNRQQDE